MSFFCLLENKPWNPYIQISGTMGDHSFPLLNNIEELEESLMRGTTNVDMTDAKGMTMLMEACITSNKAAVEVLLKYNATTTIGLWWPLEFAYT